MFKYKNLYLDKSIKRTSCLKILCIKKPHSCIKPNINQYNNTPNHTLYNNFIKDDDVIITIGIGPAGSGKTLLPCTHAINGLLNNKYKKIIITRPAVNMDEEHGFIPGDLENKMMPWLKPLYDYFLDYVTYDKLRELIRSEIIEICPLSFIRGRTFNNSFIIADEVQNCTVNQMKTLLTRIGHNSKIVLTGDLEQCDLKGINGLQDFLDKYNIYYHSTRLNNIKYEDISNSNNKSIIKIVEFKNEDIMRSEVIKKILDIYCY